jgi:hypothetical protein
MYIDENAPINTSRQSDDPGREESEVPLPADDEAPVDEEMVDVDAVNSVTSEYPEAGKSDHVDDPVVEPPMNVQDENDKEARGVPASDPESGA